MLGLMTPISNTLPQDGATPCFQRRSRIVAYGIQVRFRLVTRTGGGLSRRASKPTPHRYRAENSFLEIIPRRQPFYDEPCLPGALCFSCCPVGPWVTVLPATPASVVIPLKPNASVSCAYCFEVGQSARQPGSADCRDS